MTTLDIKQPKLDLADANAELAPLNAAERIQWADSQFGNGLMRSQVVVFNQLSYLA